MRFPLAELIAPTEVLRTESTAAAMIEAYDRVSSSRGDPTSGPPQIVLVVAQSETVAWVLLIVALLLLSASVLALYRQRRVNRELRDTEHRYRHVFEDARDIAFTLDLDRNIEMVNAAIERITGTRRDRLIGRPLTELASNPEDRRLLDEYLNAVAEDRGAGTIQILVGRRGKDQKTLELRACGMREDGELHGFQGMARDVTLRKLLDQSKLETERLEAVSRLSSGIAHDFNNLLTIIRGHAEQNLDNIDLHDEDANQNLQTILKATRQAELLTLQLMGHSRRQFQRPELLDLNEVVHQTMHNLALLLPEDIKCQEHLQAEAPFVFADRGSIEQIILNLCLNARDAMPEGGELTLRTSDEVFATETDVGSRAVPPGRYIRFVVDDNGSGMDEQTRTQIFEPFFTTKQPGKGTGLGLATVRSAVARLGGSIDVESTPGVGTRFTLHLPWSDRLPATPTPLAADGTRRRSHPRILLVEDDENVRVLLEMAMSREGMSVLALPSAEAALELDPKERAKYDGLVSDVKLPGIEGTELARTMRESKPKLAVVLMSGFAPENSQSLDELEAAYLKKPLTPADVIFQLRLRLDRAAKLV